jgi:hypothetical protein
LSLSCLCRCRMRPQASQRWTGSRVWWTCAWWQRGQVQVDCPLYAGGALPPEDGY